MANINTSTPAAPGVLHYLSLLTDMGHIPSVFTLKMGRPWRAQSLPSGFEMGPPRQCYRNAGTLAMANTALMYVEGYACPVGSIPVHHAWCVDAAGLVIDNTFEDAARSQYFGVPISHGTLVALLEATGQWGLFAEMMSAETLLSAVRDVQAGVYAVDANIATEVRDCIVRVG